MKKRKFLKLMSAMLAVLMLISLAVSCGKENSEETQASVQTQDAAEERLPLTVAKEDNGGKEFNILTVASNNLDIADESSTSVVDIALRAADVMVEEHLGITMTYGTLPGDWNDRNSFNTQLMLMSMTGDAQYDLILAKSGSSYSYVLQNNIVYDLASLEDLQLDSPWYLKDMIGTYGINGKLFAARGDASLTTYSNFGVVFFNEGLIDEYKLESPYNLVNSDEWTVEKMFEMALKVGSSNTGMEPNLSTDSFGYIGHHTASRGWMIALDVILYEKNAQDGNYYMKTALDQSTLDKWQYMYDMVENNQSAIIVPGEADVEDGHANYESGRSLFYQNYLGYSTNLKSVDWSWGVLPMPKYDADQKALYTPAAGGLISFILNSAKDAELSAKVLEVKSYYNYYDVVPSYYKDTLGYQVASSQRHIDMLEIIRENATITYLAATSANMTPDPWIVFQLDEYIRNGTTSEASLGGNLNTWYAGRKDMWNNYLKTLYSKLK